MPTTCAGSSRRCWRATPATHCSTATSRAARGGRPRTCSARSRTALNHPRVAEAIGFTGRAARREFAAPRSALRDGPHRAPCWPRRDAVDGVPRARGRVRLRLRVPGRCRRRTPPPDTGDNVRLYVPGTTRAPAAARRDRGPRRQPPLDARSGRARSLRADRGRGRRAWRDAALALAGGGSPARRGAHRSLAGEYRDPRCAWLRRREIGPRGAVLVRPDRFVAWRLPSAGSHGALRRAFTQVLGR